MVLNSAKYREIVTKQVQREKTRVRVAIHREKKRAATSGNGCVTVGNVPVTPSEADTEAKAEADTPTSNPAPVAARAAAPVLPENLDTPKFREAWEQYIAYRNRKRFKALLPESVAAQWKIMSAYGPDVSRLAIEQTIANGWQGVFPEKITDRPRGQTFKEEAKEREAALHKAKLPGLNF